MPKVEAPVAVHPMLAKDEPISIPSVSTSAGETSATADLDLLVRELEELPALEQQAIDDRDEDLLARLVARRRILEDRVREGRLRVLTERRQSLEAQLEEVERRLVAASQSTVTAHHELAAARAKVAKAEGVESGVQFQMQALAAKLDRLEAEVHAVDSVPGGLATSGRWS